MQIGDKVKIIDIEKMWDKEIYYQGWGLTDKETLICGRKERNQNGRLWHLYF